MRAPAFAFVLAMILLAAAGGLETQLTPHPRLSLAGVGGSASVRLRLFLSEEDACMDRTWVWPDGTQSFHGADCVPGTDSEEAVRRFEVGSWVVCVVLSDADRRKRVCARFEVR